MGMTTGTPEQIRTLAEIPLAGGKAAIIDASDYSWLSQWKWKLRKGYAARNIWDKEVQKHRTITMHRQILDAVDGAIIDHRDGDTLNNSRTNLRVATTQQNCFNRQVENRYGFKGVSVDKRDGRYFARIKVRGKSIYLGRFPTAELANGAYKRAAQQHAGEFARW